MPTLLLPPRYIPDSVALWRAAVEAGWGVERLPGWTPPPSSGDLEPVLYGDPLWAGVIAEALSLALLEPPLDWLVRLPAPYRKREVHVTSLRAARQVTEPSFIKPADDKSFPAQVYASGAALPADLELPEVMPVLVSEPVSWEAEFRCFVLDRQVTTLSPYLREGELAKAEDDTWPATPEETAGALAFADSLLGDLTVKAPPAFVLDVGVVAGTGWAVVEANPAWASGIYGCDPAGVLPALRRACVPRLRLTKEDAAWVVDRTLEGA